MKKTILGLLIFTLSSCDSKNNDSMNGFIIPYSACRQVPNVIPTNSFNCPGAEGTWNNYEVRRNNGGVVTSLLIWCGGSVDDHPMNQSEYDMVFVAGGDISNNDFKLGFDCASGSTTATGNGDTTENIWQKH